MILVVDDSDAARALIVAIVAPLRREILEAADGAAAWRLYQRYPISLIVTDDRMPVMTGAELVREVRQVNRSTGIVIVTAFAAPVHALDWSGCNAILRKPFDAGRLLALAESLLPPLLAEPAGGRRANGTHEP
ncbi:MAG: response regulator [Candidatus Sericytochromatia bacterium]|nr:response regulator [Candidatus Sericytochromatia bacterium]